MLSRDDLKAYCAAKPGTEGGYPFGPEVIVYKVMGKMFALMGEDIPEDQPQTINLKCDPGLAEILRQNHPAVQPGYHMDKRHWNTVTVDGSIPDEDIIDMIEQSYALIVKGLKKADREKLAKLSDEA
jgi:predicted DNA-binding protein (MmcQ/YjbR family)